MASSLLNPAVNLLALKDLESYSPSLRGKGLGVKFLLDNPVLSLETEEKYKLFNIAPSWLMSRTTEDLFNKYAAGERNFSGISLDGKDLSGVDLSGADLSNSGLGEAYLEEANLESTNLRNAHLGQACLVKANLRNADLSGANLGFSYLSATDLTNAKLVNAYLGGADMIETNLTGADLTGAELEGAYMEQCVYSNTIMPDGSISTWVGKFISMSLPVKRSVEKQSQKL